MKKCLITILISISLLLLFNNCENSVNSSIENAGILSFSALDTNHNQILDNNISFNIENVISKKRIWTKIIEIDTSIYNYLSINGLDPINDNFSYNPKIGTVCFTTSDLYDFNNERVITLPKKSNDPNMVEVQIYFFFIGDGEIKEDIIERIQLNKKNGGYDYLSFEIENPNRYLISPAEATLILNKEDIINNGISEKDINWFGSSSELEKISAKDDYFITHINKISLDSLYFDGRRFLEYSAGISLDHKHYSHSYYTGGSTFDVTNYTFVFKK